MVAMLHSFMTSDTSDSVNKDKGKESVKKLTAQSQWACLTHILASIEISIYI